MKCITFTPIWSNFFLVFYENGTFSLFLVFFFIFNKMSKKRDILVNNRHLCACKWACNAHIKRILIKFFNFETNLRFFLSFYFFLSKLRQFLLFYRQFRRTCLFLSRITDDSLYFNRNAGISL